MALNTNYLLKIDKKNGFFFSEYSVSCRQQIRSMPVILWKGSWFYGLDW